MVVLFQTITLHLITSLTLYFCRCIEVQGECKIPSAKEKKQKECASDLSDPEHQNEIFRMAKQMVKERQDITGSKCLKGVSGKVIVDEKGIKDSWYMEKLMNEENGSWSIS